MIARPNQVQQKVIRIKSSYSTLREAEPGLAYCVLSRVSFGCEAGYSILPSCAIILVVSFLYFRWYLQNLAFICYLRPLYL